MTFLELHTVVDNTSILINPSTVSCLMPYRYNGEDLTRVEFSGESRDDVVVRESYSAIVKTLCSVYQIVRVPKQLQEVES